MVSCDNISNYNVNVCLFIHKATCNNICCKSTGRRAKDLGDQHILGATKPSHVIALRDNKTRK